MSTKTRVGGFLAIAAAAALLYACNTINNVATGTGGAGAGNPNGPSSSPSPGEGGALPAGAFVRVGLFGQSCPAGTTAPPNGTRSVLLPCRGFVTATPKMPDGTDIPAVVHGPSCAWRVTAGQGVVNMAQTSEAFNVDVTCAAAGPFGLSATVKSTTGLADFTCDASTSTRSLTLGELRAAAAPLGLDFEQANGRVYFWTELASPEVRESIKARDLELVHRGSRAGAEVSASNCGNCHPPLDPDPGPPGGGGGW